MYFMYLVYNAVYLCFTYKWNCFAGNIPLILKMDCGSIPVRYEIELRTEFANDVHSFWKLKRFIFNIALSNRNWFTYMNEWYPIWYQTQNELKINFKLNQNWKKHWLWIWNWIEIDFETNESETKFIPKSYLNPILIPESEIWNWISKIIWN